MNRLLRLPIRRTWRDRASDALVIACRAAVYLGKVLLLGAALASVFAIFFVGLQPQ